MANVIFNNKVLENKVENLLTTNINFNSHMTIDNSLTAEPGMTKTVNKYTATGDVQDVAQGVGNTDNIEVSFTGVDYTVGTTQGRFVYYDEEALKDPMVIDVGMQAISQKMTNDLTEKAIAELDKATLITYSNTWTFANVVDALAKLPSEDQNGYTLFINLASVAAFRKNLKDDLKYSEGFVRTGYIGHVCGVPVVVSKAVPAGTAYIASKDAVTCFVKKGSEIEQERDANIRKNTVYARKVMLVALTNANKVVKMVEAAQ